MRLIDALELKRSISVSAVTEDGKHIFDIIDDQPTIEPERKKGKWIEFPNHTAYKCSECGRIIQTADGRKNVSKHYPFCHCGADMRGERNGRDS